MAGMSTSEGTGGRRSQPDGDAGGKSGGSAATGSQRTQSTQDLLDDTNSSWERTPSEMSGSALVQPAVDDAKADWEQDMATWRDDSTSVRTSWETLAGNTCVSSQSSVEQGEPLPPVRLSPSSLQPHRVQSYCEEARAQCVSAEAASSSGTECYWAPHSLHSHSDNDMDIRNKAVLADCPNSALTHYATELPLAHFTLVKTMKATRPQVATAAPVAQWAAAAVGLQSVRAKPGYAAVERQLQPPIILYNRVSASVVSEQPDAAPAPPQSQPQCPPAVWDEVTAVSRTVGSVVDKCTALGAAGRPHTLRMGIEPVRHSGTGPYVPLLHASLQPYNVSDATAAPPPRSKSKARHRQPHRSRHSTHTPIGHRRQSSAGRSRHRATVTAAEQLHVPPPPVHTAHSDDQDTCRDIDELNAMDQFDAGNVVSVTSPTASELHTALSADRQWHTQHWRQHMQPLAQHTGTDCAQMPQPDDGSIEGSMANGGSGSVERASERDSAPTLYEELGTAAGEQPAASEMDMDSAAVSRTNVGAPSCFESLGVGVAASTCAPNASEQTVRPAQSAMSSRTYAGGSGVLQTAVSGRESACTDAQPQRSTSPAAHNWPHWGAIHDGDTYYMWRECDPLLDTSDSDVREATSACASHRLDTTTSATWDGSKK